MGEMRGWQMQALIRDKSTAFWPGSIFPKKAVSEAPVEPDPTPPDRLQAAMELRVGVCVRLFTPVRVSSLAPVAGCEAQIPTRERALLCFCVLCSRQTAAPGDGRARFVQRLAP